MLVDIHYLQKPLAFTNTIDQINKYSQSKNPIKRHVLSRTLAVHLFLQITFQALKEALQVLILLPCACTFAAIKLVLDPINPNLMQTRVSFAQVRNHLQQSSRNVSTLIQVPRLAFDPGSASKNIAKPPLIHSVLSYPFNPPLAVIVILTTAVAIHCLSQVKEISPASFEPVTPTMPDQSTTSPSPPIETIQSDFAALSQQPLRQEPAISKQEPAHTLAVTMPAGLVPDEEIRSNSSYTPATHSFASQTNDLLQSGIVHYDYNYTPPLSSRKLLRQRYPSIPFDPPLNQGMVLGSLEYWPFMFFIPPILSVLASTLKKIKIKKSNRYIIETNRLRFIGTLILETNKGTFTVDLTHPYVSTIETPIKLKLPKSRETRPILNRLAEGIEMIRERFFGRRGDVMPITNSVESEGLSLPKAVSTHEIGKKLLPLTPPSGDGDQEKMEIMMKHIDSLSPQFVDGIKRRFSISPEELNTAGQKLTTADWMEKLTALIRTSPNTSTVAEAHKKMVSINGNISQFESYISQAQALLKGNPQMAEQYQSKIDACQKGLAKARRALSAYEQAKIISIKVDNKRCHNKGSSRGSSPKTLARSFQPPLEH